MTPTDPTPKAPPPTPPNGTSTDAPATSELPATRSAGSIGAQRMGMAPASFEEGWRLAQVMAKSDLVPTNFRNKPGDVLVAMQMGMEIGFAPMQALQSIAVINGRPSVWGDGFLALIMSSPMYRDHDEYYEVAGQRRAIVTQEDLKRDDTAAICTFVRKGKETPVTRRFSVGQAKQAGLWSKSGPWQNYPDRMLLFRARSWAGRDTFPDLLRGIRTAEEAMDEPTETAAAPLPDRSEPQRLSEMPPPAVDPPTAEPPSGGAGTDPPATDPAPSEAPSPALQTAGPVRVVNLVVSAKKAGKPTAWALHTSDGETYRVEQERLATELATFKGSPHAIRVRYTRDLGEQKVLDGFGAV